MTQSDIGEELVRVFARMSGLLLDEATVDTALRTITSLAADTVTRSVGSGITLLDASGRRVTSAATDELVRRLDDLQYELDEGPCLSAWRERAVITSAESADRWPDWRERARELGMRSFVSAPLEHGAETIGAIKVYSTVDNAYSAGDADVLHRFASQAAIFVANVRSVRTTEHLSDDVKRALRTRETIATARGIVMARDGVDAAAAFRYLAEQSLRSRMPLSGIADDVIAALGTDGPS